MLAERLKYHRSEKSREQLADRACLHRTYLAGIEAARPNPSLRSIILDNAVPVLCGRLSAYRIGRISFSQGARCPCWSSLL